jgi:nitrogen fixation protein NifQ
MAMLPFEEASEAQDRGEAAAAIYRMLTGGDWEETDIADDEGFDRHVLASILALASSEDGTVAERAGLTPTDISSLIARWFPTAHDTVVAWTLQSGGSDDDEIAMVRDLLLANVSSEGDTGRWLAAMVARRGMEPNHLWEDLGLRNRSELTRLLSRHFAPLAVRNVKNMKWKRFFYRTLCETDGLVMCSTPVCSRCGDFDVCFGDESGESRLAYRRSTLALKVASFTDAESSHLSLP